MESLQHWNNIYATKQAHEVSWTQALPKTSLEFIHAATLPKEAAIIDIGGGDSKLVDFLLEEGFKNISVLDISEEALTRAKKRLGVKANYVNWIVSDITSFHPTTFYQFWHDRATFHFLTTTVQIEKYMATARQAVKPGGFVTIGTFSDRGPTQCSGLNIRQYTEATLTKELDNGFEKIKCLTEDHETPFHTLQNFLFCSFKRTVS
ncbi:MAG: class I SAM-dependent methyltransferase [Bacteroidetes bacterium]|nr:class I SAM-dependent methyltransferase [Bacteroidota bacterium]MBS1540055.1 class I SAM-dependent methyltransferase [Bacteroidota bacterium]